MQHKKKSKQTLKIRWIILLIVIMIAIVVIALITINKKEESTTSGQPANILNNASSDLGNIIDNTTVMENKTEEEKRSNTNLSGTYIYNENVKYEYKDEGKGTMYDSDMEFEFVYTVKDNNLEIDFMLDALRDASYTFTLEGKNLTLIGGEGTTGGEYRLQKETK